MAKEYEIEINGQPAWYSNQTRKFKIYFSEPEQQVNRETGILLLIAGYGGNANSNVYRKMRDYFADRYNLVTLQCDYLGWQFMQNDQHMPITETMLRKVLTPREFRNLEKDYAGNQQILKGKILSGYVSLQETAEEYNEMGLCQAMDHLMALQVLQDILMENHLEYCRERIYIYGQSHGAYLAYLCNRLAPCCFQGIIENSAYILPYYLDHERQVIKEGELFALQKIYHYLISDQEYDRESYDLKHLYSGYENRARIISFHGMDDEMVSLQEKQDFLNSIPNVSLHVISKENVDGEVFRSSGHSLGADLIRLFDMAFQELELSRTEIKKDEIEESVRITTQRYSYWIDREYGVPILYRRLTDERSLGKESQ